MALYLWQCALNSGGWRKQIAGDINSLDDYAAATAKDFGGEVQNIWIAFGEYDFIAVVEMPDNEGMAAFVLAMIGDGSGYFSAGKTTVLLSAAEGRAAMKRAGAHIGIS